MKEIRLRKEIKQAMVKKFGTQAKFCRLSGYDRYELQILFAVHRPPLFRLLELRKLVNSTRSDKKDPIDLTPKIVSAMAKEIENRGGIRAFCEEHGFNQSNLYRVLAGERKRINEFVKQVLSKLDIQI